MKKCDIPLNVKIREVRKTKKWSQEALGAEINYSRASIYQLESGIQPCTKSTLLGIKKALV